MSIGKKIECTTKKKIIIRMTIEIIYISKIALLTSSIDPFRSGMGGGFNPGPNGGAILTPRRNIGPRGGLLPEMGISGIQGTKPVGMRQNMGPPPPYQTENHYPQQNGKLQGQNSSIQLQSSY